MPVRAFILLSFFAGLAASTLSADDWPCWRGSDRTNVCRETGLLRSWPEAGPPLLWKSESLGEGFASCSVVQDVIYSMGNRDGYELVIALNSQDGSEKWATPIGAVRHDGAGYPGPRSTPTYDDGHLYALGLNGDLVGLDARDGRLLWRRNLVAELGGQIPTWGFSESVLIDGAWVVCTPGGSQATLAALDKKSGATVWESVVGDGAGYASVISMSPGGASQYVQFTAQGVIGVRSRDGALLWRYNAPANGTANIATPIADGSFVFAASGYGTGGGLVQLQLGEQNVTAKEVYFTKNMKNHHGGMVLIDGYLYGSNDPGLLTCLEFKTGKVMWKDRTPGKCSLLYADGQLYARSEEGKLCLVEARPDEFVLAGQFLQPDRSSHPSWPHPVIADGRLYLRDQNVLLCYDVRDPARQASTKER